MDSEIINKSWIMDGDPATGWVILEQDDPDLPPVVICETWGAGTRPDPDEETIARLLAASPKLLGAALQAYDWLTVEAGLVGDSAGNAQARVALADAIKLVLPTLFEDKRDASKTKG